MKVLILLLVCIAVIAADGPYQYELLPTYGNQSADGTFNVRFYGLIYKRDDSNDNVNVASDFITSDIIQQLNNDATTSEEKNNLQMNLDPFLHWDFQHGEKVTFNIPTGNVNVVMNDESDTAGEIDQFGSFTDSQITIGNQYQYTAVDPQDSSGFRGNFTIYPANGWAVVSDLDDVLRITQIWEPFTGLKNTFEEDYVPVPGMPALFANWSRTLPNPSFHYATTTPIPLAGAYIRWLPTTYPLGTLDMRPVDLFHPDDVLNARQDQLERLGETFPKRKFIMVGDTSSNTLIKAYPEFARNFPSQLGCIFIRNITYTYPDYSNSLIDLEKEFEGVPRTKWFVFNTPEELYSTDIVGGNCHPAGVPANQTTSSGGYGGTRTSNSAVTTSATSLITLFVVLVLIA
jgi:phosphatidate phosphatase APP1